MDDNQPKSSKILLLNALKYVKKNNNLRALDIGCSIFNESKILLKKGFFVKAIDNNKSLKKESQKIISDKFIYLNHSVVDCVIEKNYYDIVIAFYSLPFILPNNFDKTFKKIKESIKKNGVFCGHFFGKNDDFSKKRRYQYTLKKK